jgi:hypothetical protein
MSPVRAAKSLPLARPAGRKTMPVRGIRVLMTRLQNVAIKTTLFARIAYLFRF